MLLSMINTASVLLYTAAGLCVFLILFNRLLLMMNDSWFKVPVIHLSFVVIAAGAVLSGFLLPGRPWIYLPIGVLCVFLVGEVCRFFIRRKLVGSGPVDTKLRKVNLLRPLTTRDLACYRYQVAIDGWKGLALRIVHFSDLHAGSSVSAEFYQKIFNLVEESDPDMVFITGDFVSDVKSLPILKELLRPVGKHGTFAVIGNHDYWADAEKVRSVVSECGINLLANESVGIEIAGGAVSIKGIDYPRVDGEEIMAASEPGELGLVLSHTPDNIYRISKTGADCVFAGHCHAGQIRLPFAGAIVVPSVYGRRFDHGHFVVNGTHLFVTGGIGTTNLPVRIYCRPDIFIVDITGRS